MGEHLPCKQGVKSSNLSISICRRYGGRRWKTAGIRLYLENSIQIKQSTESKISKKRKARKRAPEKTAGEGQRPQRYGGCGRAEAQ